MDVNEKLQQFGQSLEEISNKEYRQIEQDVDNEIKIGIEEEIKEYENKKQANFDKTSQRIEKDYNKKVYNYEIQCKKEIIDEQKNLKENLKKLLTGASKVIYLESTFVDLPQTCCELS